MILHYISFTSYLSTALSKILPHSKTKNVKKLSAFGKNDSCHSSNFLQMHIFWNFDHISRICNQINYRNIWFPKVIIILIMMAQVLFFNPFPQKDLDLNAIEKCLAGCLQTKWFWVWVKLHSLKLQFARLLWARSSLTFMQLQCMDSLWNMCMTWQEHTMKCSIQIITQNTAQSFGQFNQMAEWSFTI